MSVVLEPGAGSASPVDPLVRHEWVLPALPSGDPAAVRAVAVALRELAWRVRAGQRAAEAVVADLRRAAWRGGAALSTRGPVEQLASSASRVASALESLATALDDYARKLAEAQRDHGWSWKKIAVVTGVVVVGAGLVVLTAGAGAPAAAVVGAEVATASAAASAAVAAEVTVAASLTQSLAVVRGLHVLSRFVVPRLYVGAVQAPMWASTPLGGTAVGASTAAAMDYAETGSVDARSVAFGALLGFAEGASTSGLRAAGRVSTEAVARCVAAEFSATVEPAKGGWKVRVQHGRRELVLRVMEAGGVQPEAYWRLSVSGGQSFSRTGEVTTDRKLTHIRLEPTDADTIAALIRKLLKERK